MIFIILIVVAFGLVLGAMQFGSAPAGGTMTTVSSRAVLYAQNMETWHQAAMQTITLDKAAIAADPACVPANPNAAFACDLNQYLRDKTTFALITDNSVSPLAKGWPEYQPVVAEGNPTQQTSGGWQSFLIKNIDGTCADPANAACPANASESYILTVFRGFGYGGTLASSNIGNAKGGLDNTQLAAGLAQTIQDRMGVGNLTCTGTVCTFTRAASFNLPVGGTTSDLPLGFPVSAFTPLVGTSLPAGQTPDQTFNGLPAIMTRLAGGGSTTKFCPAQGFEWAAGASTGVWATMPLSAASLGAGYNCYINFPQTTAPNPVVFASGAGNDAADTVGFSGATTATCDAGGSYASGGTPFRLPNCTANGGGQSCSANGGCCSTSQSTSGCCSANSSWTCSGSSPNLLNGQSASSSCSGQNVTGTIYSTCHNGSLSTSVNCNCSGSVTF